MRLLKTIVILCLTMVLSVIFDMNISATMRIVPGYYEQYERYLKREGTENEEVVIKEEIKEATYNPDNLREKSNLSKEQIYNMLEGNNLQVLADKYHEMEEKYNINAIFLIALNIEESGHGKSSLAVYNNNLGGIKSRHGGYATFESWDSCLEYIASLIDEMYLSETGAYYNGTSIYGVNVRYCIGGNWAANLNNIANELLEKVEVVNDISNVEDNINKVDKKINTIKINTNNMIFHRF